MIVALGALVMANVPTATAFHGSPYRADGTASIVIAGTQYDFGATLWWLGAGLGGGNYKIELKTLDTNLLFHTNQFAGQERFTNIKFVNSADCHFQPNGLLETLDYRGFSTMPLQGTVLDISGWQHNDLCTGTQSMHYEGHYLGFTLDLDVWAHI
jgi:hypothetical protein